MCYISNQIILFSLIFFKHPKGQKYICLIPGLSAAEQEPPTTDIRDTYLSYMTCITLYCKLYQILNLTKTKLTTVNNSFCRGKSCPASVSLWS